MADPLLPDPPAKPRSLWTARIILVLLVAVAAPVAASILYTFPPSESSFYPGCYFNKFTGLHCPGCGVTRCVHALLHLDFAQAWAWNPLFVLILPLIFYALGRMAFEMWTGRRPKRFRFPSWAIAALLGVLLAYWVIRNIPYQPFTLLAPHQVSRQE